MKIRASVLVSQAGVDEVMDLKVCGRKRLGCEVVVAGQALDAFQINLKFSEDGSWQTVYDAAGEFTAPAGLLLATSGDLTVQGVGSGWFIIDVSGVYAVQVKASSGNVAGSTVTLLGDLT